MDVFYCPMNTEKIEHIIIKELDIGFVTSIKPHILSKTKENDEFLDMNSFLEISKLRHVEEEINQDYSLAWSLFDKAVETLVEVKKTRDDLEGIYSSNMNFEVTSKVAEKLLDKILSYI